MTAGPARTVFDGTGTTGAWGDYLRAAGPAPAGARRGGDREPARLQSAAVFGNRFFAEVVTTVDRLSGAEGDGVTVRMIAADTGLVDSVVRPVMRRLCDGGLIDGPGPGAGKARSALHYQVRRTPLWAAVLSACAALA
jgi:hypothetical protein